MISYSELVYSVLIAFLYLLILPFQLVIFPSTYYSVRDIIYSKSLKKAIYAAASRLLFIVFLSFVFEIIGVSKRTIELFYLGLLWEAFCAHGRLFINIVYLHFLIVK